MTGQHSTLGRQQRVSREHREIRELLQALYGALEDGVAGDAQRRFTLLRMSVEAHLDGEERIDHPPFRGLSDEHHAMLARFAAAHAYIRVRLEEVARQMQARNLPAVRRDLEAIFERLRRHEDEERALFAASGTEVPVAD